MQLFVERAGRKTCHETSTTIISFFTIIQHIIMRMSQVKRSPNYELRQ